MKPKKELLPNRLSLRKRTYLFEPCKKLKQSKHQRQRIHKYTLQTPKAKNKSRKRKP